MTEPSTAAAGNCRVLIVDDNVDAADMLATLLQLDGHDVRIAHDAETALHVAGEFTPEVGLFDIGLPQTDGYELARQVRGDKRLLDMYLVAVTGWGEEDDRRRAAEAGFDSHITKPAEPEALRQVLASATACQNGRAASTRAT
jgi:CheY-like chemotaxis protein